MDTELFELCKEVSKLLPDWKTGTYIELDTKGKYIGTVSFVGLEVPHEAVWSGHKFITLYTSDYLLEKLPKEIYKDELIYRIIVGAKFGDEFKANYVTPSGILYFFLEPEADSPLQALLQLTLALHKAGELK